MNSRQRFLETMRYGAPDRVPYFEEGLREGVLAAWQQQGLLPDADLSQMFPTDRRNEISLDVNPLPSLKKWPRKTSELDALRRCLNPSDKKRLPKDWKERKHLWKNDDVVRMLRTHDGLFLSLGVDAAERFNEVIFLLKDDPQFVHEVLAIQGEFVARLTDRVLQEVTADAVIFSEPIGGNHGALISPAMFEEFALKSYQPVLDVLHKHNVEWIVWRTYANARALIPSIIKAGFNCLWACEVNVEAMDYRDIRREFGRDLRLIGGIDLDALRHDKDAIRRELEEKVPPLLADGGYVPLADGRVRPDVPFENYLYYRELLQHLTGG
jgi:uroporphyrinogen decarboxylase